MSLLQTIETNSNFPLVLKIVGIVLFAVAFLASWSHIPLFYRLMMIVGLLMFFVGLRFVKIYTPVKLP
jgi:hypothetical protein